MIQAGDIILIRSHNITAKIIHVGMNVEKWLHFKFKPFWKKIYNHAAIGVGKDVISEALSKGITVNCLKDAYPKGRNVELKVYRYPLTNTDINKILKVALRYEGTKYQFINFLQYIPKILFNVWLGKTHKQSQDILYCTEYVALVLHKGLDKKLFKKYWKTSPNDIADWCKLNCDLIDTIIIK